MLNIKKLYELFQANPEIITDSRKAKSNSIFFALKGSRYDGNLFAEQAIKNGCTIAICDYKSVIRNDKYIYVKNTLKTLQELAAYHRKVINIPVISITGTNGKTTTKELIREVLSKKYKIFATRGNLNNHIGVPLSLLSIKKNTEIGIIEMGANHTGEIDALCKIAAPNYGIITNIGKAHLEGFGTIEGILNAKTEMYKYLNKKGIVFVNSGNHLLLSKLNGFNGEVIKYGINDNDFVKGEIINNDFFVNGKIIFFPDSEIIIKSKLFGAYNFENILTAACIGKYFKVNANEIKNAIENYNPDNNRSQVIYTKKNTLLLDAYNANPSSMEKALTFFNNLKIERKIIILGDMLELGNASVEEHENIIKELKVNNKVIVYLIGKQFTQCLSSYNTFKDVEEFTSYIKNNEIKGYTILIKGSRGMQLEKLVDYL